MLGTIAVTLCLLWLMGVAMSYTFGGLIHIFLVVAFLIVVVRVSRNRRRKSSVDFEYKR